MVSPEKVPRQADRKDVGAVVSKEYSERPVIQTPSQETRLRNPCDCSETCLPDVHCARACFVHGHIYGLGSSALRDEYPA